MLTGITKEHLRPDFAEPHYTLVELATHWHMSVRTVRGWFLDEPGVIKFGVGKLTKERKRTYISLRVPESVALKVYREMTGKEIRQGRPKETPPKPAALIRKE